MRQLVLVILLVLSLGYALYTYWPMISSLLPKFEKTTTTTTVIYPSPEATETISRSEEVSLSSTVASEPAEVKLVDPFSLRIPVKRKIIVESKPAEEKKEIIKPKEPVLEGIWIDSGMRVAFISGQALGVGGSIMGWRITSIQKDRVILQKGPTKKILKMEGK